MRHVVGSGLLACAVAVTFVLAGCGENDPASTAPPPSPPAVLDATAVDLLTQSGSFHSQQHAVTVAEETLVGQCMRDAGLAYPSKLPPADSRTDEDRALRIEERRRIGYGLSREDEGDVPALDRYVRDLPAKQQDEFTHALFGAEEKRRAIELPGSGPVSFPGEGCLFEAQQKIFGDILTWARVTYVPEELNNKLSNSVTSAPAYVRAMRKWSSCMARHGYRYALPADAQKDLAARYKAEGKNDRLLAHEIAVAVADTACAGEVGIVRLVLDLKRDLASALPESERRSLTELAHDWSRAVRKARMIAQS